MCEAHVVKDFAIITDYSLNFISELKIKKCTESDVQYFLIIYFM